LDSIEYYNKHANEYFQKTVDIDMQDHWDAFTSLLPEGASILDLGCGSGRDSAYFLSCGYDVTMLDASYEMCNLASIHTGQEALNLSYEDMEFHNVFDGIWACASLVHIPRSKVDGILHKAVRALKVNGIMYMSFHYGDFEGIRDGRYFTDYRGRTLRELIMRQANVELIDIQMCKDSKAGEGDDDKEHYWIYAIIRKTHE